MSEYIERETAIKALMNDAPEQVGYSREDAADCIRYMDAADVATVRHGYWRPILHKDGKTDYECSCCLGIIMDVPDDEEHDLCAWCSMCGAKMTEVLSDGTEPV